MKRNLLSLLVLFVMIMLALGSMDSTDVVTLPSEQSTELQPKATEVPSPTTSEDSKTTRKDSPAPRKTSQLIVEDWRFTRENTFVTAAGRVTNNTASALKNVMAVVTFVTADGEFVKTSEALISYNPVLPGQTSPFEAIASDNPEIAKASISFKFLLGGTLSSTTREEVNKPTPEELAAQRKGEEAQRKAEESEMAARRQAQQEVDRVRKEKEDLVAEFGRMSIGSEMSQVKCMTTQNLKVATSRIRTNR